jgi:hypothetical protein
MNPATTFGKDASIPATFSMPGSPGSPIVWPAAVMAATTTRTPGLYLPQ